MSEILEAKEKSFIVKESVQREDVPIRKRGIWNKIIREPFLHFIILGAIIFYIADNIKEYKERKKYEINLTNEDIYRIATMWEKQYGSIPTKKELENLVQNFIKEEIFYRQGVEMGLDKEDEVIRRRIAQKMEFLQQDLVIVKEPTDEALKSYFQKKTDKYKVQEKLSFTHVFFSPDKGGDEAAIARANEARVILASQRTHRAPELGDNFPFLYDYSDISKIDVVHLLGESPLSQQIFHLPVNQWSAPLKSGYGYHLVYVNNKKASSVPAFGEIRDKVKTDFLEEERQLKNEEAFLKVKKNYNIIKPDIDEIK